MYYGNYQPYHLPLTQEQDDEINSLMQTRAAGPVDMGFTIQNNRVVMNDPVLNAYARFAYERADKELLSVMMPMVQGLHRDYPDIDPMGKRSLKEMEFAQRAARLEMAASTCDPEIKNQVNAFLFQCQIKTDGTLAGNVAKACREIQNNEYAAKVCRAENIKDLFTQQAKNIADNDPDIQKMDQFFTLLEQVTGLKGGNLNQDAIEEFNSLNRFANLKADMPTGNHVRRTMPETLYFTFQNFDHIVMQEYYANPQNRHAIITGAAPKEPTNRKALDDCMDRYATATATNALDLLFEPLEQFSKKTHLDVHRATLTIVDGKTISEHMQERYNALPDRGPYDDFYVNQLKSMLNEDMLKKIDSRMQNIYNGEQGTKGQPVPAEWYNNNVKNIFRTFVGQETFDYVNGKIDEAYNNAPQRPADFNQWYNSNLKQMSGEILASALMAGKRVEAYVPGPDGKLPDQPTVLQKSGYAPKPEKPVTLNAWERFFNKFGFYKGKAAKAKEQQAFADARERLKATYVVAQTDRISNVGSLMKGMFFGDFMRRNNLSDMKDLVSILGSHVPNTGKAERGSFTTPCIGMMAAMGHDIRDILDPTKLIQEKRDVGNLFMEKMLTNQTIVQLTDPNLGQKQRTQLTDKLVDDLYRHADNLVNASRPQMSEKLAKLRVEDRQELAVWGAANQELSAKQSEELWQLKNQARNAAKNPMTEAQKLRLSELSQHQEKWTLWRDLQRWQQKMADHRETAQQIRLSAQQDANNLMGLLNEARDPNFKLNLTDPRIPKYLQEGNPQWVGSVLFHGQQALTQQVNNIMANTDLNDPAQRRALMPVLSCATQCMYDGMQDIVDDRIALGFYKAATQSVLDIAELDENTGKLTVRNPSAKDATVVAGKSIEDATEALVSKYTGASNDLGNLFTALRLGDEARAKLIQPYSNPNDFSALLGNLVTEKEVMRRINPNQEQPFSDRIPKGDISSGLRFTVQGGVDALPNVNILGSKLRPDAKTVLSGNLTNFVDLTVKTASRTSVHNNAQVLRMDPYGKWHVVRGAVPESNDVVTPTVKWCPEAEKKLGLGSKSRSNSPVR